MHTQLPPSKVTYGWLFTKVGVLYNKGEQSSIFLTHYNTSIWESGKWYPSPGLYLIQWVA